MANREGINPLRPYYIPPSGLSPASNAPPEVTSPSSAQVFGSTARDLIPDLDYADYLDASPSVSDWVRDALNGALVRYTKVLTAQPFDVAKTILQVYVVPDAADEELDREPTPDKAGSSYDSESESSDDESSYFTSAAPPAPTPSTPRSRRSRRQITDRSGYLRPESTAKPQHALTLKNSNNLTEVLSQLWTSSGPTSLWKSSNATFIYSLLLPTLNTFIRSLLSAIVGLPEDDISSSMAADILTASSPLTTLVLSFVSSSLSALILAPIDTARTFLMLTSATHGPRSLIRAIRQLPTPNCTIPSHLVPITVLHSSLPNFIMTSTPLFLKTYFSIDPLLNPNTWNLCTFLSSGLELAVRFPLETVLRRAQIATYTSLSLRQKSSAGSIRAASIDASDVETIVPTPRTYRGIVGTMWHIIYEEGISSTPSDSERANHLLGNPSTRKSLQKRQQGQGIHGLYRGWRIGMWGIAGIWGASLLGGVAGGSEDEVTTRGGHGRSSGGRF
ncbi:unnamed protein product [Penicillium salamii]|uniref:Mitochondrial fusion protein n=1 Tax=Penicillium salamii TaxID=1612424 RepID=A0A9W4IW55_9EURO|nr:unnamed protein product [Penicillium salamii]CAG8312812.1 unnamed protein product [Penicillium salamii]CAG8339781.1 unnamed protein product [Penicillium salamii]CAG8364120.1 unnamed protein product [Penicillium salamii]CAG8373687.1 unnamed protein product [Penicillium salamii]